MLRELLRIFGSSDPLREMGDNFGRMLDLTREASVVMPLDKVDYYDEHEASADPGGSPS